MTKEETRLLQFKCPKCGSNRLECCEDGPYVSEVLVIDKEGDFEYLQEIRWKVRGYLVNLCHLIVGISTGEFYPVLGEYLAIRQNYSNI